MQSSALDRGSSYYRLPKLAQATVSETGGDRSSSAGEPPECPGTGDQQARSPVSTRTSARASASSPEPCVAASADRPSGDHAAADNPVIASLSLPATHRCCYLIIIIIFLNLGRSSRGGRQKLILEIIALMVNHPSGSHQQSSRAAG